jgi:hypothetical protein
MRLRELFVTRLLCKLVTEGTNCSRGLADREEVLFPERNSTCGMVAPPVALKEYELLHSLTGHIVRQSLPSEFIKLM